MRLLKLRLKNLNSLSGEWEIDFSHPTYASEGLFIITGPTGSGKTTILDALCLALYAKTPRLGSLSKNSNEIMSRQAGDCLAEATFEAQGEIYRATFQQHRAGRKSGETLQPVHQEIVRANSGQVIGKGEAKINKVLELVGMDFERFTKSILLAQGGFAAFLEASAKDRSPILERVTGTGVYGQISALAYRRAAEEKTALAILEKELESLASLPDDERETLEKSVLELGEEEKALEEETRKDQLALSWRQKTTQLRAELGSLAQQSQVLALEMAEFQPQAEKLSLGLKALELESLYESLSGLRRAQEKDQDSQIKERDLSQALTLELAQAQNSLTEGALALSHKEADRQAALPVLEKARDCDRQMATLAETKAKEEKEAQKIQDRQEKLAQKLTACKANLFSTEEKLAQTQKTLLERAADESLSEDLAGLEKEASFWLATQNEAQNAQKELARTQGGLEAIKKNKAQAAQALVASQKSLELLEKEKLELDARLNDLIKPSRAEWQGQAEKTEENLNLLTEAKRLGAELAKVKENLTGLENKKSDLAQKLAQTAQEEERVSQNVLDREKRVELLTKNLNLAQAVASLEERRAELVAGEPCPLCGSKEHPYAAVGAPPALGQLAKELAAGKDLLKKAQKNLGDLAKTLAALKQDEKNLGSSLTENSQNKDALETRLQALFQDAPADWLLAELAEPNWPDQVNQILEKTQNERAAIRERLAAADQLTVKITANAERSQKAQKELALAQNKELEAGFSLKKTEADIERLTGESNGLKNQAEERGKNLAERMTLYGYANLANVDLKKALSALKARKDLWQKLTQERLELEKSLIAIRGSIELETPNLSSLAQDLAEKRQAINALTTQGQEILEKRRAILGNLDPDKESERLESAIRVADKNVKTFEAAFRKIETNLKISQEKTVALTKASQERLGQIQEKISLFNEALGAKGLRDEATFLQARLTEDERDHLLAQRESLAQREANLSSLVKDKTAQSLELEAQNLTTALEPELIETINAKHNRLKEIRVVMGSNKEKLERDAKIKAQTLEKTRLIATQKGKYARADKLSSLIGQADGAKFRIFAQSLTFERLVQNANEQLRKMSSRYLLRQDEKFGLELNVIDNYQGGLIRPIRNLSGGETFLVSLALALGLSIMSSQNVEVNSLFLDEGFGTLDEDSLDMALSALADLPQSEGKTIGLISHVAGLEQRIATQIKVIPHVGGQSRLVGPGCRQISS